MKDWDSGRCTVKNAGESGRQSGMSDEHIRNAVVEVGDFLCARAREDELLKEMRNHVTSEERKRLTSVPIKSIE